MGDPNLKITKDDIRWAIGFLKENDPKAYRLHREQVEESRAAHAAESGVVDAKPKPKPKAKTPTAKKKAAAKPKSKWSMVKKNATLKDCSPKGPNVGYPAMFILAMPGTERKRAKAAWDGMMKKYAAEICGRDPAVQWPMAVAIFKNYASKRGIDITAREKPSAKKAKASVEATTVYQDESHLHHELIASLDAEAGVGTGETLEAATYQGRKVTLNKPFRTPGGPKKSAVYVKNDKGNVVKVTFGDPTMSIKKSDPERRKSFRARHKCDNPGPKWKARYWSCKAW